MASTTALDLRRGAAIGRAAVLARYATSWVFLIPTLVFFVGWQLYPIFRVLWMSFTDYHFLRNQPAQWVGFLNYANAFADPLVLTGLVRAATFTVLFLPGMIFVPMLLAILVDRVSHPTLATTYRLILLIPAVIPGPLIFVLWKWLYNFNIGPIDYLLAQIGLVTPQT
ncbi:MAG: sugar ABC transporter permease, partial [Chloroflexi bacterium]